VTAKDTQIGGEHYKKMAIQPADYIIRNGIGWAEGCAIAYLSRWQDKGGIEDLKKAVHTIQLLIESKEGKVPPEAMEFLKSDQSF
jgi:hypothetical protein